ncbi:hypothetical protein [Thermomonospora amylolytica]|uniref:hypothetical protein n=1 Tax=Thermomonospora amylolytica TaxID=1411117 RepID=UPI000E6C1B5E|nr:hypothetical protein [Thermomonospora amylolytica]
MGVVDAGCRSELRERQARLLRLHWELTRLGVRVSVRKPRNGRWKLKLRGRRWSETVLCAGAEGTYAYVTAHGRLLGRAEDARHVARILVWMLEMRVR